MPYIIILVSAIDLIFPNIEERCYSYCINLISKLLQESVGEENILLYSPSFNEMNLQLLNILSIRIKNINLRKLFYNIKNKVAVSKGFVYHLDNTSNMIKLR